MMSGKGERVAERRGDESPRDAPKLNIWHPGGDAASTPGCLGLSSSSVLDSSCFLLACAQLGRLRVLVPASRVEDHDPFPSSWLQPESVVYCGHLESRKLEDSFLSFLRPLK